MSWKILAESEPNSAESGNWVGIVLRAPNQKVTAGVKLRLREGKLKGKLHKKQGLLLEPETLRLVLPRMATLAANGAGEFDVKLAVKILQAKLDINGLEVAVRFTKDGFGVQYMKASCAEVPAILSALYSSLELYDSLFNEVAVETPEIEYSI